MNEEVSVWDLFTPWVQFFDYLGTSWLAGSESVTTDAPPVTGYGLDSTLYPTPNEYVQTVFDQVVTGWKPETVVDFWGPLFFISLSFSLLLSVGIVYCAMRILQIRREERARFAKIAAPVAAQDVPRTQLRWNRILEQIASEDEQQWRLAILEADIMLNDLIDSLGYKGETMADKMKQIDVSTFNTIDYAWEAHKIRNRVAHEGTAHVLNDREARRVIKMYERVFKEFKYVD